MREGARAEVVCGVDVGVCVCWRGKKKHKKRDNAVHDLPITRKLYAVQFAKAA